MTAGRTPAGPAPAAAPGAAPDILVIVGTDHHRFGRVVTWTDEWLAAHPGVTALVQHGTSPSPARAQGRALVPYAELQDLMRRCRVVVSHGGPATITEVRRLGKLPVVVPRDPALDEHVDGHQQRFARRMGELGLVVLCETREAYGRALDAATADPASFAVTADDEAERIRETVERYGQILDEVIAAGRRGARSR